MPKRRAAHATWDQDIQASLRTLLYLRIEICALIVVSTTTVIAVIKIFLILVHQTDQVGIARHFWWGTNHQIVLQILPHCIWFNISIRLVTLAHRLWLYFTHDIRSKSVCFILFGSSLECRSRCWFKGSYHWKNRCSTASFCQRKTRKMHQQKCQSFTHTSIPDCSCP